MGYTCIKAQKHKFLFLVLQFQFRTVANFSRKSKGIQWPTKDEMMVSSYCVQLGTYRFILLWSSSREFVIEATSTLLWTQFYNKLNQILTTNLAYFLVCQHNVHLFHEAKFHIDPMLHKQAMPNLKHLQLVVGVLKQCIQLCWVALRGNQLSQVTMISQNLFAFSVLMYLVFDQSTPLS